MNPWYLYSFVFHQKGGDCWLSIYPLILYVMFVLMKDKKESLDICSLIIFYNDIMELLIIFGYIMGLPWSCDLRYDLVMERIIKLA